MASPDTVANVPEGELGENATRAAADEAEQYRRYVDELVSRCEAGDTSALPELQLLLDREPDVCQAMGDLPNYLIERFLTLMAGKHEARKECVRRRLAQMRVELEGANPTPVERLLAERAVVTWLQLHHAELVCSASDEASLRHRGFLEKRAESISRRYLRSLQLIEKTRVLLGMQARLRGARGAALTESVPAIETAPGPASISDDEASAGGETQKPLRVFPAGQATG
jgi:hypothetical protein